MNQLYKLQSAIYTCGIAEASFSRTPWSHRTYYVVLLQTVICRKRGFALIIFVITGLAWCLRHTQNHFQMYEGSMQQPNERLPSVSSF